MMNNRVVYQQHFDSNKNKYYFSNRKTKKTLWKLPKIVSKAISVEESNHQTSNLLENNDELETNKQKEEEQLKQTTDVNNKQQQHDDDVSAARATFRQLISSTSTLQKQQAEENESTNNKVVVEQQQVEESNENNNNNITQSNETGVESVEQSDASSSITESPQVNDENSPPKRRQSAFFQQPYQQQEQQQEEEETAKVVSEDSTTTTTTPPPRRKSVLFSNSDTELPTPDLSLSPPEVDINLTIDVGETVVATNALSSPSKSRDRKSSVKSDSGDDLFGDFSYASEQMFTGNAGADVLDFRSQELADTDTSDEPRTRSFLGRTTLLSHYETIKDQRGELEVQTESDIFQDINSGEVHVIAAITAQYSSMPIRRKREEVHVSIARDWTGAFVLCLSRTSTTGFMKKEKLVMACYPLIESFEIQVLDVVKTSCRFILVVDRHSIHLYSGLKSKEKLEKYLKYAFNEIHRVETDEAVLNMRMASIDFARMVEGNSPQPERCGEVLDSIMYENVPDMRGALLNLQRLMRYSQVRDMVLTRLVGFMKSEEYNPDKAALVLDIYSETIHCPVPTNLPRIEMDLIDLFEQMIKTEQEKENIAEKLRAERAERLLDTGLSSTSDETSDRTSSTASEKILSHLNIRTISLGLIGGESDTGSEQTTDSQQIEEVIVGGNQQVIEKAKLAIVQTQIMYQVSSQWKGRGALPDVLFPQEFSSIPKTITVLPRRCERDKEKLRKHYQNESMGVYLMTVLYTDDEILADQMGLLPHIKLPNCMYKTFQTADASSDDFDWLFNLGKDWSNCACDFENIEKRRSLSPFKRDVIKAAEELTRMLGGIDLGILYDRFITVPELSSVLLLSFKKVHEKSDFQIDKSMPSDKFSWQPREIIEHKLYQGYNDLTPTTRLDKMEDNFYGPRWIENGIKWYNQFQSNPLEHGMYLCYLRFCVDENGFYLLIQDDLRMMPPVLKICGGVPPREDWEWVQGIRLRQEKGIPLIEDDKDVTIDTPYEDCITFKQKYLKTILQMQKNIGVETLGHLYDEEIVMMDEESRVMLICYVDNVPLTVGNMAAWKGKYFWRKLSVVENANSYAFMSDICGAYKDYVLQYHSRNPIIQECEYTKDEVMRIKPDIFELPDLIKAESAWVFMRWMTRLINWCQKGAPSLTDTIKDKDAIIDIDAEVRKAVKKVSPINIEVRRIILSRKPNESWDTVYEKLLPVESSKTKANRIRNRYRPSFIAKKRVNIKELAETEDVEDEDEKDKILRAPATFHNAECTVEDVFRRDELVLAPTSKEVCSCFTQEFIELALIQAEDRKELRIIKDVVEGLVSIVESVDLLTEDVEIMVEQEEMAAELLEERQVYKQSWYNLYEEIGVASLRDSEDMEVAVNEANASYDNYVRDMVYQFNAGVERSVKLFTVVCAVQDCIELVDAFDEYEETMIRQDNTMHEVMVPEALDEDELFEQEPTTLVEAIAQDTPVVDDEMVEDAIHQTITSDSRVQDVIQKTVEKALPVLNGTYSPHKSPIKEVYSSNYDNMSISSESVRSSTASESGYSTRSSGSTAGWSTTSSSLSTVAKVPAKGERNIINIVTKDDVTFHLQIFNGFNEDRCAIFRKRSLLGVLHVSYLASVVEFIVEYLLTDDVPSFLGTLEDRVRIEPVDVSRLFAMTKEFEIAQMYIILASLLPNIDEHELLLKFANSFLLDSSVQDWTNWEKEFRYVRRSAKLFDMLYYMRFVAEFDRDDIYIEYKKKWRRMYAEMRITMFFNQPNKFQKKYFVDVTEQNKKSKIQSEILLWKKHLGTSVRKLNFSNKTVYGDRELEVVALTCPQIGYINVCNTSVTDESLHLLISKCTQLRHINVKGTQISSNQIIITKKFCSTVEHDL
jgi:hypothetical protein